MSCDGFVTSGDCQQLVDFTHKIVAAAELNEHRRWFATAASMLTAIGFILVALTGFEAVRWGIPVLPNDQPRLDVYGYGRSALTASLSFILLLILVRQASVHRMRAMSIGEHVIAVLALALLLALLALFLISPQAFSAMSLEDRPIEWASALLPIAASLLLLWRGASLLRTAQGQRTVLWAGSALILSAGVLFVLGMEEISWMQRVFGWATPESLSGNIQGELNLHNLATNQIGTLHKIGGFAFLIFLPFLQATAPQGVVTPRVAQFMPSRCAALVSAPLAAFNYNGWDFLPMQMTTYLTVGIVVFFAWQASREGRSSEMVLCAAMAIAIAAAQILFICLGDRFTRIWDVTEYKELFIAFGLFVWATEVFHRLAARTTSAAIRS
jgi:hypothetical protein